MQRSETPFVDVVLRFRRQSYYEDEHVFQLEVRKAPPPLSGGAFRVEIEEQLREFQRIFVERLALNRFMSRFADADNRRDITELGRELYALLPEAFRQTFPPTVQEIFEGGQGLRLILEAQAGDRADRLLGLPWELLFFETTGVFLARSPRVLVVRRLLDAVRRSRPMSRLPLDVLHVIAHSPTAPEECRIEPGLRQIERERIPEAIRPGSYELVAQPGSVDQMLDALKAGRYDVVHFLGHGEIGGAGPGERGYLRFLAPGDVPQTVTGEQLQHLLDYSATVWLVVLNACHGGANVARSVALELVYNGLPYVVAMQADIRQDAAGYFIDAFYAQLQTGQPIEYAVAAGRAEIAAHLPGAIDWSLPVLYTNAGLEPPPRYERESEALWHWFSEPQARRRLGWANLFTGVAHLTVGTLLLLSGQRVALPDPAYILVPTLLAALLPPVALLDLRRRRPQLFPAGWSRQLRAALALRTLGSATIGFGMSFFYLWFALLLVVGTGFWDLLAPAAQIALLLAIFVPGAFVSYGAARAQAVGHTRAFVSETGVEMPQPDLRDLVLVVGGYILILTPVVALTLWRTLVAPPYGNLISATILILVGYALLRAEEDDTDHE